MVLRPYEDWKPSARNSTLRGEGIRKSDDLAVSTLLTTAVVVLTASLRNWQLRENCEKWR